MVHGFSRFCDNTKVIAFLLFLLAFIFRLSALGRYVTPDELVWVYRSFLFGQALKTGAWADTLIAGHPGVITTWLGALGIELQLFFRPEDIETYQWISKLAWLSPDNSVAFQKLNQFLTSGRLLVIFVNSSGIVGVYLLAKRLLSACMALLLAALLVIDSFTSGLSGIFHVDGLLSTFVILSLLSLVLAVKDGESDKKGGKIIYAAVSGGTAALAVLSKSPALMIGPVTALFFLYILFTRRKDGLFERLKSLFLIGLIWVASFTILIFVLFPALWTASLEVLQFAGGNANRHIAEALRPTFFLGQMAFDHGAIFYPIAIAWRISPVVTVGLILFTIRIIRQDDSEQSKLLIGNLLLIWVLFFVILITLTAKKFDRYALPVIPALMVLAVIGWSYWLRKGGRWPYTVLFGLLSLQLIYSIFAFAYPLSTYNLLLGGPFSAQYVMPIGWGESVSSAGRWLSEQEGVSDQSAVSGITPSLAPFFSGQTLYIDGMEELTRGDFVIFTANSRQSAPAQVEKVTEAFELLHVIRYGGLAQSWIYANPQPRTDDVTSIDLDDPISFDGKITLIGQAIQSEIDEIKVTVRWRRADPVSNYNVKIKLQDERDHTWAELETDLLNEVYFHPVDWTSSETPVIEYELDIPPTIPPGEYKIELSLIDVNNGAQLPVIKEGAFAGVVYEAGNVSLDEPGRDFVKEPPNYEIVDNISWLSDSLKIVGLTINPRDVASGASTTVDLFWQSDGGLPVGLQLAFQVNEEDPVLFPLSRFDSGEWLPGKIVQEKYRITIPANSEAGPATVRLWPILSEGQSLDAIELGMINIQSIDRLFSLPDQIPYPLAIRFEPHIWLRGAAEIDALIQPGQKLPITLYWQAEDKTEQPVTAFAHLLDNNGNIVAQSDRWPGGLPSNVWASGQVIVDDHSLDIPEELPPGTYQLAVGLYFAHNGQRLPAADVGGERISDDRFILPVVLELSS